MSTRLFALAFIFFSVQAFAQPAVTVDLSAGTIRATVTGGPGQRLDFVTISPTSAHDSAYLDWFYLNGTKIQPATGVSSAVVTFVAPGIGTYNIRLYTDNRIANKLATSAPFAISSAPAPAPLPVLLVHGDSNTGNDYVSGAQNWAAQVAVALGLALDNMAISGLYSDGVMADLPTMQAKRAALCMVMIGTNDVAAAVLYGTTLAGYVSRMRVIVDGLRSTCGKTVILTPPFSLHPLEVSRLEAVTVALREIAAAVDVKLIDVWGHMRSLAAVQAAPQFESYYLQPAADRYHLSPAGHAMLAAYVLQQSR